jgi:small-conductance mechanosensitive channel
MIHRKMGVRIMSVGRSRCVHGVITLTEKNWCCKFSISVLRLDAICQSIIKTMRKTSHSKTTLLLITGLLLFVIGMVTGEARAEDADVIVTAPVVLDGETLFRVRGVSALPAGQRAANISRRIVAFAADEAMPTDAIRTEVKGELRTIKAGDQFLLSLVEADASLEDISLDTLAMVASESIRAGVVRYREQRQPRELLIKFAEAVGIVLAVVVFIVLLVKLKAWVVVSFERRMKARIANIENMARKLVRAEQIWQIGEALLLFSFGLLMVVTVSLGASEVLSLFPWTRGVGRILHEASMTPLISAGQSLLDYLPKLIALVLIVLLFRLLLKTTRAMFDAIEQGRIQLQGFDREWTWPTYRLVRFGVLAFAVVMAYPFIPGSQSEAFKGMTLLLGLLFSIGSTSIISNIIAGYSMAFRRAFKIGDRIRVGNTVGDVTERRLLVTHLLTVRNEEVVIPNSLILSSEVVNYSTMSRDEGVIVSTTVGIGYDTPWRQVESMLLLAASRTQGKKPGTQPFVRQKSLNSYDVTYEINIFCESAQQMPLLGTELNRQVLDIFNEYNVQIMTPSYETDPPGLKVVPPAQWYAAPAQPPGEG